MVASAVIAAPGWAECSCFDSWHGNSDASGVVFFALVIAVNGQIFFFGDASRSQPVVAVL